MSAVAAVRTEIADLEQRLSNLRRAERVLLGLGEVAADSSPAPSVLPPEPAPVAAQTIPSPASAPGVAEAVLLAEMAARRRTGSAAETAVERAPSRASPARRSRTYRAPPVESALEPIRAALTAEPRNIAQLAGVLGCAANPAVRDVIRHALKQLDARLDPRTGLWQIGAPPMIVSAPPTDSIDASTATGNGHAPPPDLDEQVDQAYLERRVLDVLRVEPASPLTVAAKIDAPEGQVRLACERLTRAGSLSLMGDGSYVG